MFFKKLHTNKAAIIATGDELSKGLSVDTNSSYLARELLLLGFSIYSIQILPDDKAIISHNIKKLICIKDIDIIVMTGGLGPTEDDLSIDILAEMFHSDTMYEPNTLNKIQTLSVKQPHRIGKSIGKRQARILTKGEFLVNTVGLAPGVWMAHKKNRFLVAMPGVPSEMQAMFKEAVIPKIRKEFPLLMEKKRYIFYLFGIGESRFQEELHQLLGSTMKQIKWGIQSKPSYLRIHIEAVTDFDKACREQSDDFLLKKIEEKIKLHFMDYYMDESPVKKIFELCSKYSYTLMFAESCTGGSLSTEITEYPGASEFFKGSIVSYANEIKRDTLKVPQKIINKYGAVSEECASEMARGLKKLANIDFAVAITGIAGPSGGTVEKGVGTVYIAIASWIHNKENIKVIHLNHPARRKQVREAAVNRSLFELCRSIMRHSSAEER